MAAVESLFNLSLRAVRTRILHGRVWSLQELCRRCLVSTRSLPQWKALTQNFAAERIRRRACLFSIFYFSGCGVNFCVQRHFSVSNHLSYWVTCTLDKKRYMAVRAPNYNVDRLLDDDNLWHWARLEHPHVLSVLAVVGNMQGIYMYLVTLPPDDGLEHFAGILAVRDLCVHELHLWKFLRQLCSALIYLRGQGLTVEPFDFFNVYLRRTDLVLNNGFVWNQRRFEITSLPGSLWSLLLRPGDDFAALCAAISTTEREAKAFSVAVVVAQLVALAISDDPAGAASRRRTSASGCLQAVHRMYGVELVPSPCSYTQQLVSTLAEMFRTPQPALEAVQDKAGLMYESMASS
ncbi:hypothetical protein HPB50_019807 [Hyalomma asiaticum]|uniref:Uncharacterized protein n=1 Tax=Hyalomma asiaticum TaxID=266040 RepID=A0ACB7RYT3_HYAAI|nr:hypothetical protein HPB50_019807 [Hyalomma asiaticum]